MGQMERDAILWIFGIIVVSFGAGAIGILVGYIAKLIAGG